jgi:hypothetical protein
VLELVCAGSDVSSAARRHRNRATSPGSEKSPHPDMLLDRMLLDRRRELMEICGMIERGEIRIASRSAPRPRRKK